MNNFYATSTRVIAVLILTIILAGCGRKNETHLKETDKPAQIEFAWWGNDPRHLYTMEGIDLFEEQNPDIEVECRYGIWNGYETRNRIYMRAHTEPDVMQINFSWIDQYSPAGDGYYDLYKLTDYLDLSGYSENDLSFGEVDGKLNAIPIAYNSTVIFYNEDIFKSHGLDLPKTWNDLFDAAEVLSTDGIYPIGCVKKHLTLLLISYFEQIKGKKVFDENGRCQLSRGDVAFLLAFYNRMIEKKVLLPIEQFDRSLLSAGKLAGAVCWISDVENYCSSIEAAGTPALGEYLRQSEHSNLVGWYKKPATMYAIGAGTQNPAEAARLINFLVNDPQMAILQGTEKGIPVSKYALNAVEEAGLLEGYLVEANEQMLEADDELQVMIPAMENSDFIDAFKAGADYYLYEKAAVSDTAGYIYDEIQKLNAKLEQNSSE